MKVNLYRTVYSRELIPTISIMNISGIKFIVFQWWSFRASFSWGAYKEEPSLFPDDYCEPIK